MSHRKLINFLIGVELLFAVAVLAIGAWTLKNAWNACPQPVAMAIRTTLNGYAEVLDSQRDNVDRSFSKMGTYAKTMRSVMIVLDDVDDVARQLEKLANFSGGSLPFWGEIRPFQALAPLAVDLRQSLPEMIASLEDSAETLEQYTPEAHEEVMRSLDNTILTLRLAADTIEEQFASWRRTLIWFSVLGAMLGATLVINGILFSFMMQCRNQPKISPIS